MKKAVHILSLFLALLIVFSSLTVAYAVDVSDATLYNIYGDSMLFQQNEKAVLSGNAKSGSTVSCKVYNKNNKLYAEASSTSNGEFEISFDAPCGSYDEYTIEMYQNGKLFDTLSNVVFGELWLANGQSNMQYNLGGVYEGSDWSSEGKKLDKWIRALYVPALSTVNGEAKCLDSVQKDIEGCTWVTGEEKGIYNISAVGYFFAASLREDLDMPVGILNVPLGGSSIMSWLSRESVEASDEIKTAMTDRYYISHSDWNEDGSSQYIQMTSNYNMKIYPLRNFNPTGMIWYQGETDVQIGFTAKEYEAMFFAMQDTYSELFGFENSKMPIIFTQLAQYNYGLEGKLEQMQVGFAEMQKARPDSIAMTTIYDVGLDYFSFAGPIHPGIKRPVGERMAYCAKGFIYGNYDTYTAAYVESSRTEGNSIYVTLSHTGSGLKLNGDTAYGFAIADKSGTFVKANAEIVSGNTVRIWNDKIKEPVSASYAYDFVKTRANLYATDENGYAMPVSSFIINKPDELEIWYDDAWADFDTEQIWMMADKLELNGFADAWSGENCSIAVRSDSAYSGDGGLNITGDGKFSIISDRTYKNNKNKKFYSNYRLDYSDYGTMTVRVRNDGDEDVKLNGVKLYTKVKAKVWYSPEVNGTGNADIVIPADGKWYTLSFDLNSLYRKGNECGAVYSNKKLKELSKIAFEFSADNADISIDSIEFSAEADNVGLRFAQNLKNADNPLEFFCGLFTSILAVFWH